MENINYSNSVLSLVPPILAIILAIITKRELLSLITGVFVGSIMLNYNKPTAAVTNSFVKIFWDSGVNTSNLYILLFLIILGTITSLISISGGTQAFARWALTKIKNRKQSTILVVCLGFLIFIDDYFNSLAVGNISRPVTDHYRVSRAKLAYLIDSTSAPICAVFPVSSWGAYLIGLIGPLFIYHGVTDISAVEAFIEIIPMSYYPVFSLLMIICVVLFDINIGPMRKHEELAITKGILLDESKEKAPGSINIKNVCEGKVIDLLIPLSILISSIFVFIFYFGKQALINANQPITLMSIIEYTDVAKSLFFGAILSLICIVVILAKRPISLANWIKTTKTGVKSMLPAVLILILAWMLGDIISQLQTGKYMTYLISQSLPVFVMPVLIFFIAGAIAITTGTSWGTFSIMLPIAIDMSMAADINILLPAMAAVISGAVFGDHCSPISDTTILSATGASCHFMDHVITQLPYALCVAGISSIGYLVLGATHSVICSFFVVATIFILLIVILTKNKKFK